ncbi:MAG: cytochrome c [Rhizobiaceae bacterium]|nr:cytochrome c [Rhizobiaceae bacterium]MCV0405531.1 cytochrome c [Rhizobiaceae bacterium]
MKFALSIIAATGLTLGVVTAVVAQDDPVERRIAIMKDNGRQLGQIVPMTRGEKDFDAEVVAAAFQKLADNAASIDVDALFPEGSDMHAETKAAPAIWEKMDEFKAAMDKLKADTAEVAANPPTELAALGPAIGQVGQNCGSCHENFRLEDN